MIEYYAVTQQLLVQISKFLERLETSEDMPLHHQADICQFRGEVLEDDHIEMDIYGE